MESTNNSHNRLQDVIKGMEQKGFTFKPDNKFYRDLGIHKRRFGQFMRNEKQPTLDELARLANAFSVDLSDLIFIKVAAKNSN